MTEQEVLQLYQELEEHYGDKLVNFEHHPLQFLWQAQVYLYYKQRENERNEK